VYDGETSRLLKYADDTYLILLTCASSTFQDELKHIVEWSRENNLRLNSAKSREIVVVAKGKLPALHKHMNDIIRVDCITALGVHMNSPMTLDDHVTETIKACSTHRD